MSEFEEIRKHAISWAQAHGINIVSTFDINKIHKKDKIQSILALSETDIFIFSKSRFLNKIKNTNTHYLADLKAVEIIGESEANIDFKDGGIRFISSNVERIVNTIVGQCHMLSTKDEFDKIPIPRRIDSFPKSTPLSFLYRLQYDLNKLKEPVSIADIRTLQSDLFYGVPILQLNDFPMKEDVLNILFNALCLKSGFTEIQIGKVNEFDIFNILPYYFHFSSNIKHINFKTKPTEAFSRFISRYKSSTKPKLASIGFTRVDTSKSDLSQMLSATNADRITSLSFEKSFNFETFVSFVKMAEFQRLKSLSVRSLIHFNLGNVSAYFNNLISLSLVDCGLSIGDVLNAFSERNMENLRFLNLSKNIGNTLTRSLPPKLTSLFVDNVQWTQREFTYFMSVCSSHQYPLELSVANAQFTDGSMEPALTTISDLKKCPFSALVWDGNYFNTNLIIFLKHSAYLKHLSLCGCSAAMAVGDICMFLEKNEIIETLRIAGNGSLGMGDITPVCDMLPMCPNLRQLDISQQGISNAEIKYLAQKLTQCPSMEMVNLQGTNATSLTPFFELANAMQSTGRLFKISWPFSDLQRLQESGRVKPEDETNLLNALQNLAYGTTFAYVLQKPNCVFTGTGALEFPKYLSHKRLRQILETPLETVRVPIKIAEKNIPRIGPIEAPRPSTFVDPSKLESKKSSDDEYDDDQQMKLPMPSKIPQPSTFKQPQKRSPSPQRIPSPVKKAKQKGWTLCDAVMDWSFPIDDPEIDENDPKIAEINEQYSIASLMKNITI